MFRSGALVGFLVSSLFAALPPVTTAQSEGTENEIGRPFLTCYSPEEFDAHTQSWAFAQTSAGVMYVGNGAGLLEFDGSSWRTILTSNRRFVRSLAVSSDDRVFVGSAGEFGYLAPDSLGQMQFVSLMEELPEEHRTFSYVWSTLATPEGVYFQAHERMFRVNPDGEGWKVDVWLPTGQFAYNFWLDDTLFVHQTGVGLMKMVGDSLQLLPGGDQFARDRIHMLLPRKSQGVAGGGVERIVGTFARGLFLYDGKSIRPWRNEATDALIHSTPYSPVVLPDGNYGIGTLAGGFLVMSPEGRVLRRIGTESGLPSTSVLSVFVDSEGGTWLAPENGVCRIEIPSPLSLFDRSRGLAEFPMDIRRHDGTLYASTTTGVYALNKRTGHFQRVSGMDVGNRQAWQFASVAGDLLAATGEGVFKIDGLRATPVRPNPDGHSYASLALRTSKLDSNRVFVGLFDGAASLYRTPGGGWIDEGRLDGLTGYMSSIIEPEPGTLWFARSDGEVIRMHYSVGSNQPDSLSSPVGGSGELQGLLFDTSVGLFMATRDAVLIYDEASDSFVPDSLLSSINRREKLEYAIHDDHDGNLWVNLGRETVFLEKQADGTFKNVRTAALRFHDQPAIGVFSEDNGVVWFATTTSLIRYDSNLDKDYERPYSAMIRRVVAGDDDVIMAGPILREAGAGTAVRLSSDRNSLRFAFTAPSLDRPRETVYQSRLDGFDRDWSPWSKEAFRVYTNLSHGEYRFRVRARNVYGVESREAAYAFAIMPPWYRTWFAYLAYLLLAGGGVWLLVKLRTNQLQARSRELEYVVEQRTHELREQKENVEVLSRIGRDITATLDFDTILRRLYENVNRLMDASVFGVGVYDAEREVIEYRLAMERGKRYEPYTRDMRDKDQLPVWCIENRESILITNFENEYAKYMTRPTDDGKLLEDGSLSELPMSLIYLPLIAKDRVLGVLTVQSFERDAYNDYDMSILETLAAYASVALDNAYAYRRLNETLDHLKAVQQQLIHQEKLASLGSMTAGIAHEIKNPLNFVNNFAALSVELVDEIEESLNGAMDRLDPDDAQTLKEALADLRLNCDKIEEHGRRANGIVKSMLEHSRGTAADRREVDINEVVDEYVSLAFHGTRAQDVSFTCDVERDLGPSTGACEISPQEIGRVLINLLNNAFHAVNERRKSATESYAPRVRASTRTVRDGVEISVWDNGGGIPQAVRDRIFEPFFTTKPAGEGTGLGLSLSYEIVTQGHGGRLDVECEDGEWTEFTVFLPRNGHLNRPAAEAVAESLN